MQAAHYKDFMPASAYKRPLKGAGISLYGLLTGDHEPGSYE